jgi:WD40 repeat protein
MDGTRKSALLMHGSLLIVADSSPEGLITLFDINTWKRTHNIKAGAPVTLLKANDKLLVAGTSTGRCFAWLLPNPSSSHQGSEDLYRAGPQEGFLVEDPSPSGSSAPRPCTTLALGTMPDGSHLLVALSPLGCKMKVWKLPEGKLLQALIQPVNEENAESRAVRTNILFSFCEGPMFTTISYLPGHDPVVQVMDLLARQAEDVKAPERLRGRGRPLCACFDGGKILAVGFEDGAVAVFGMFGWLGFHQGAQVGSIRVLPDRLQVLSGASDGRVKLWSAKGQLMSTLEIGFQVTVLSEMAQGGVVAAG